MSTCSATLLLTLHLISAQAKTVGEFGGDEGGSGVTLCCPSYLESMISLIPLQ